MANHRTIMFECFVPIERLPEVTPEAISDAASATYVALNVVKKGYLSEGGDPFVLGVVHTSSMRGSDLISHLLSCAVKETLIVAYYDDGRDEFYVMHPGDATTRLVKD